MSEKAIIFDIQRSSINDGPGIRTTVFLKGCPLECLWCHNPEATEANPQLFFYFDKCVHCGECEALCKENVHRIENGKHWVDYDKCTFCKKCIENCKANALKHVGTEMKVDEVMQEVLPDLDFYESSGGGITISGGEPLSQFAFTKELLKTCKQEGISTCIETSGFVSPSQFEKILPLVDILLFDYKVTSSAKHQEYTGVPSEAILKNLHTAYTFRIPVILRCPIIPGINDDEEHFKAISKIDADYPNLHGIEILPYHTMGNSKRTSIGVNETLTHLESVPPEVSEVWIKQLHKLGCVKAKIG